MAMINNVKESVGSIKDAEMILGAAKWKSGKDIRDEFEAIPGYVKQVVENMKMDSATEIKRLSRLCLAVGARQVERGRVAYQVNPVPFWITSGLTIAGLAGIFFLRRRNAHVQIG